MPAPLTHARPLHLGTALLAMSASAVAPASVVDGIAPMVQSPPIVRGGALVLPLQAERPGAGWPETLTLGLEDGRSVVASVVWIGPQDAPLHRRWTDDPSRLALRRITAEDDTAAPRSGGGPFLVAALPDDVSGTVRVVDGRPRSDGRPAPTAILRPTWLDPPPQLEGGAQLEREWRDDLPDPTSPFDHWRWELVAQRRELLPPQPLATHATGAIGAIVARHAAELWRAGLARLARTSPGVAAECLEMLTNVVEVDGATIAAWVTDPVETATLLGILLDTARSDQELVAAALAWADSRDPLTIWLDDAMPSVVQVMLANARVEPQSIAIGWLQERQRGGESDAVELPGARVTSLPLRRPTAPESDPVVRRDRQPEAMTITISHRDRRRRLPVPPASVSVVPPGALLTAFRPALRLQEIRTGGQEAMPGERQTVAILRRVQRRWELLVECARPTAPKDQDAIALDANGAGAAWPPRGTEAITVMIGPTDAPTAVLCVPETGAWWIEFATAPALEVHRRSDAQSWICRIVLPPNWLPESGSEPLLLGLARTHGDHGGIETAGLPRPAWRERPATMAFDLSRWDD